MHVAPQPVSKNHATLWRNATCVDIPIVNLSLDSMRVLEKDFLNYSSILSVPEAA